MKLDILVPCYKEDVSVIKPLLDSIALQQCVDFDDIGVIVCCDGGTLVLDDAVTECYPFRIEYYMCEHKGVSATRNACLDRSRADYVMFCDADDIFFNACGLYIIFREFENGGFDSLISAFVEETRDFKTRMPVFVNHDMDSTFVHGKVHRRCFLVDNNIRWNENLTIHEDSYFNCLCQKLAKELKYCPTTFYLWKWRDDSVCRHDPLYLLKTFNNMLDSSTALVKEFLNRGKLEEAQFYCTAMIFDSYFTLNKDEWINQDNQAYRKAVEERFKLYFSEFETVFNSVKPEVKTQIVMGIKTRMFGEGLLMEHITFDDWIKEVKSCTKSTSI